MQTFTPREQDLDELRQEVELVLSKLSEIIPRLSFANQTVAGMPQPLREEYLSERLENILEAIKAAKLHPSGRGGIAIS